MCCCCFVTEQAALACWPPLHSLAVGFVARGAAVPALQQVALVPASDSGPCLRCAEELAKENNKSVAALKGQAVFSIAKVDAVTGEIAGVFESVQPSDTDLGAKAPKDIKITGLW